MALQIPQHVAERQRFHVCSSSPTGVSLLLSLVTAPCPSCWIYSFVFPFSRLCSNFTFLGRRNTPSTGCCTPAEALSRTTDRESMKSQANSVYSPFSPHVFFYLFHTVMESHLRITLFCSLHVLSCRIATHPVVLPPSGLYSQWTKLHIYLSSWILVSFLFQSIYEITK